MHISLTFVYVPGHQDALSRVEDLTPLARLNVWADTMAKQELHRLASLPQRPSVPSSLLGERWHALAPTGKITSDPSPMVTDLLGHREALRYWSHKQQLDAQSFELVNWEALERATDSFPPTLQMWLSKFASGHSAVAVTMHRWKRWSTPLCPLCQSCEETTEHVLYCLNDSSRESWRQQLTKLQTWLEQSNTAPSIQRCFILTLSNAPGSSFHASADALCSAAAQDQDNIRIFGFLMGRIASKWTAIQALHYMATESSRSATLWMSRLCRQLILLSHAMWLSRNHQVFLAQQQQTLTSTREAIHLQFQQGTTNLLPVDQFYVTPGPQGFSLQQVLDLPIDDQQLWLHAVSNARTRGQNLPEPFF